MAQSPVSAEDILAAGQENAEFGGTSVRKGNVAAFVANARALESDQLDGSEREALIHRLRELVPALRAVGVFDVFELRSPSLRAALDSP